MSTQSITARVSTRLQAGARRTGSGTEEDPDERAERLGQYAVEAAAWWDERERRIEALTTHHAARPSAPVRRPRGPGTLRQLVLSWLRDHGPSLIRDIACALDVTPITIRQCLHLVRTGKQPLVCVRQDGRWWITEAGCAVANATASPLEGQHD